jgi:hypothetical protein
MATFRVRIELPDRPGALGAVASRIGAVRGDVVSVEIIRRQDGRAVDEFVVELADAEHVPLLLVEIGEVDGVTVETVHPISVTMPDHRIDAYETAAALLKERAPSGVLTVLASRVLHELGASWSAVFDREDQLVIATAGDPPPVGWLTTSVGDSTRPPSEGEDVAWVHLASWDLTLVVGRPTWPFGASERARLDALARLADARWIDLSEREPRMTHPSHGALT